MSASIRHLRAEHGEARAFLRALEQHARELRMDPHGDSREASALFEYLAEIFFVKHEEKEETVLLPELIRLRTTIEPEILRILRDQHHRGQALLDELWKSLRPGETWDIAQREAFLRHTSSWLRFIRGHLRYEEEFLFPAFEDVILQSSDDGLDQQLLREFEKIDREYEHIPDASPLRDAAQAFVSNHSVEATAE